jgi:hypothetical protein
MGKPQKQSDSSGRPGRKEKQRTSARLVRYIRCLLC